MPKNRQIFLCWQRYILCVLWTRFSSIFSRRFKTPPTNYAMIISKLYKPPLLNINAYNMFNRPLRGRTHWIDFHSKYKAVLRGDSPTDDFCILRVCRGLWIKRFSMAIREGAVEESLFLFLRHFSLRNADFL